MIKKPKIAYFEIKNTFFLPFFLLKPLLYLYLRKQNNNYFIHLTNFLTNLHYEQD